jgi:TolA-binding protein
MRGTFWLIILVAAAAIGWLIWHAIGKWKARQRAEEERAASFLVGITGAARSMDLAKATAATAAAAPVPPLPAAVRPTEGDGLAQQKLLFEAAHKAGEAGEPALAIQLFARLLVRYPASSFAGQARAAVETQKKKIAKA